MLPVLRITWFGYRVQANCVNRGFPSQRLSRTGPPRAAMAARCALHQNALSFFVHVLFTLFCRRGALVVRRAESWALPARCGGGGGGGGDASADFLVSGSIIARLLKARTSYLYLEPAALRAAVLHPMLGWSTCGPRQTSRLRLQQLPPCERSTARSSRCCARAAGPAAGALHGWLQLCAGPARRLAACAAEGGAEQALCRKGGRAGGWRHCREEQERRRRQDASGVERACM